MKNINKNTSRRSFLKKTTLYGLGTMALPPFLASFLTGCEDDFLDRQPLDSITDVSFWKTEEQLKLAVNALLRLFKRQKCGRYGKPGR